MALIQKLKNIFQPVAHKYIAPFAAGAALLAGGCQSVLEPKKITWINHSPVTDMFEQNMGPHKPANDNMTEDQRLDHYIKTLCFEFGDTDIKTPANAEIQLTLGEIAGLTLLGRPLLTIADEMNVKFCGLDGLPAGVAALYFPGMDTLVTSSARSKQDLMMQLAHEMMHAAQDEQGLMTGYYRWDIDSRARRTLATEAAASTVEMLIAYEAKLAGKPDYWAALELGLTFSATSDSVSLNLLEQNYRAGINKGMTHQDALMQAGRAVFENVFNNPYWLKFYLNRELGLYIDNVVFGAAIVPVKASFFDQKMIEKAGQIGQSPSFTQGAQVPSLDELLARDPKMKWAYEAVEIERARRAFDSGNAQVIGMMETAMKGKNPYLWVDVFAALKQHRDDENGKNGTRVFRFLYEYMDDAIKTKPPLNDSPFLSGGSTLPFGHGYLAASWAQGCNHDHRPNDRCGRARPPVSSPPPSF